MEQSRDTPRGPVPVEGRQGSRELMRLYAQMYPAGKSEMVTSGKTLFDFEPDVRGKIFKRAVLGSNERILPGPDLRLSKNAWRAFNFAINTTEVKQRDYQRDIGTITYREKISTDGTKSPGFQGLGKIQKGIVLFLGVLAIGYIASRL